MDDAARLLDRLNALPPREERLLREHCLHGRALPELAAWLGVAPEAAAIALVRAALGFAGVAGDEQALSRALLTGSAPTPLAEVFATLRTHAGAITALAKARLDATARRDQALRWAAAIALVLLAWALSQAH